MKAETRRALVRYLVSYAAAGGHSEFVERTQAEIEKSLEEDERRIEELERAVARLEGREVTQPGAGAVVVVDVLADELVAMLFSNGAGDIGDRLVIEKAGEYDLGGYNRRAVREHVLATLRKATPAPAVLEAQHDETIDRVILALRATSLWFNTGASAPNILFKLAEFLEKPDYARTTIERTRTR